MKCLVKRRFHRWYDSFRCVRCYCHVLCSKLPAEMHGKPSRNLKYRQHLQICVAAAENRGNQQQIVCPIDWYAW